MANETIFRDKAVERISSPDMLNEYVKLADPGLWFILFGIMVILAGACVFGAFGHIDSTVPGVGIAKDGEFVCVVKKEYGKRLKKEMRLLIDGAGYEGMLVSEKPVPLDESTDSYALYLGDLQPGEWVYEIVSEETFDDGAYQVKVVTEEVSPLSFLLGSNE